MHTGLVIGVDSGGTATRAAVADVGGRVLGVGGAGQGNLRDVGPEGFAAAVSGAVGAAFDAAGLRRWPAEAAFVGVAGCATENDRRSGLAALAGLEIARPDAVEIDHDLRTAHAGAFLDGAGMVLIVGTGACCYGRDPDGREQRAGGWGGRIDDGGGAAWMGQQALAAVCRGEDGRGPRTVLGERVLDALGVGSAREAVLLLEEAGYRRRFGGLAPLVTAAAEEEDPAALAVVERGAEELAGMVAAVAAGLGGGGAGGVVCPVGGVLASGRVVRGAVSRAVAARVAGCRIVEPEARPEVGAVFLALRRLGPVGAAARESLRRFGQA